MGKINQVNEKVGFKRAIKDFYVGMFDFKGRTSRAGFWWATLYVVIAAFIGSIFLGVVAYSLILNILSGNSLDFAMLGGNIVLLLLLIPVFFVGFYIPILSTSVRRYRDAGLTNPFIIVCVVLPILFSVTGIGGSSLIITLISYAISIFTFIISLVPAEYCLTDSENPVMQFMFKSKKV